MGSHTKATLTKITHYTIIDLAHEITLLLELGDYHDSIHCRDSLRLFMNKIVDCLTI